MSKRLLISSTLLLGCVIGIANFSHSAEARNVCDNYNRGKGTLTAHVDLKAGKSRIKNTSDKCAYKVGVASYKIYNKQTGHPQELYDVAYGTVGKNDTL
jgi:hypothetical protein